MATLAAPFGWPGGKHQLKARIIPLIPPHKTYVEPFAGAASVFWAKPRSPVEVLNDLDVDLMRFYKALPGVDHCDVHTLGQDFPTLVAKQGQQAPCEFLAGVMCSFGGNRRSTTVGRQPCFRNAPTFHQNLPRYKERLQGVRLHNEDWKTTTQRYDASDTFFYFDPPYHDMTTPHDYKHSQDQLVRLADALPRLKGKWLLSYSDNPEVRAAFQGFPLRPFRLTTSPNKRVPHARTELIIANFPLR